MQQSENKRRGGSKVSVLCDSKQLSFNTIYKEIHMFVIYEMTTVAVIDDKMTKMQKQLNEINN